MAGGLDTATAAHAFKVAFKTLISTALAASPPTGAYKVVFGRPRKFTEPNIVSLGRVEVGREAGPLSVTNRSRDEQIELDVVISSYVEGTDDDAEERASEAAHAILRTIDRYVRITDTTIGDTVRECHLERHTSDGMSSAATVKSGSNIFVTATFRGIVRVTA